MTARRSAVEQLLDEAHARVPGNRPVPWCLVDEQSAAAVALADRLTMSHGAGLSYLSGVPWSADQAPGLPPEAVSRLLRTSRVRYWWSGGGELDVERVRESVEHGCLPLQAMDVGPAEVLRRRLPRRLRDCVVAVAPGGFPELPDVTEARRRLLRVAAHLAAHSPERDQLRAQIALRA